MAVPRIAVGPVPFGPAEDAIRAGGGEVVPPEEADAIVWMASRRADQLAEVLAAAPQLRWVQLPMAGVERFAAKGLITGDRVWTCAKEIYGEPVAEMALALALAGLRQVTTSSRAGTWGRGSGRSLYDGRVTVLGAGGITRALLDLLRPFRVSTTVVRRRPDPFEGADSTVGEDRLADALEGADVVFLALALTPETTGIIGKDQLACMSDRAWLVNVARGAHVRTDDLVEALAAGSIAGAALDVTDPEPLPDGHPLWALPNCIITPHQANTDTMAIPPLMRRVRDNVARFAAGRPLEGLVDPDVGY